MPRFSTRHQKKKEECLGFKKWNFWSLFDDDPTQTDDNTNDRQKKEKKSISDTKTEEGPFFLSFFLSFFVLFDRQDPQTTNTHTNIVIPTTTRAQIAKKRPPPKKKVDIETPLSLSLFCSSSASLVWWSAAEGVGLRPKERQGVSGKEILI